MAHWQEALRTDPGVFEAHLSLAIALFDMERLPEARLHASIALRVRPGDRMAASILAMTGSGTGTR